MMVTVRSNHVVSARSCFALIFLFAASTPSCFSEDALSTALHARNASLGQYIGHIEGAGVGTLTRIVEEIANDSPAFRFDPAKAIEVVSDSFLLLGPDRSSRASILEPALRALTVRTELSEAARRSLLSLVNNFGGMGIGDEVLVRNNTARHASRWMARLEALSRMSPQAREVIHVARCVANGSESMDELGLRVEKLSQTDVSQIALYSALIRKEPGAPNKVLDGLLRVCKEAGFTAVLPSEKEVSEFADLVQKLANEIEGTKPIAKTVGDIESASESSKPLPLLGLIVGALLIGLLIIILFVGGRSPNK